MESDVTLRLAEPADAPQLLSVIREAFGARPPVDPPAEALTDTLSDIEAALSLGFGVLAHRADELIGGLLVALDGQVATLRRVSVVPGAAGHGVARQLVTAAAVAAAELGATRCELFARSEFPELISWWRDNGFEPVAEEPHGVRMGRDLPVVLEVPTADVMQQLGHQLAALLRAGDVVVASGDLGAGKTTLAQGIGAGLGVTGPIISPTFVLSRVHPNPNGPALVHVDAYRLGDAAELADIDLDATLATSVTLIEWGAGISEWLSAERLLIEIDLDDTGQGRIVTLTGIGPRWAGALETLRKGR